MPLRAANNDATYRAQMAEIQHSFRDMHPSDRAGAVQRAAKARGIPSKYSKPIYATINSGGGIKRYTHDDLVTDHKPSYRT